MTEPHTPVTNVDLSGHTALITGASSGLGARFAHVLAAAGARVVIAARRTERPECAVPHVSPSRVDVRPTLAAAGACAAARTGLCGGRGPTRPNL